MAHVTGYQDTGARLQRLGAMTLPPQPESVPRARDWFRKLAARQRLDCSVDDCLLMLSELVTNAIVHGRDEDGWSVRVEWWRDGEALRVDVHNPGSPAGVRMRRPAASDTHGRGMCIVDALADSWHAGPSRFGGTLVSFVMDHALAR